MRRLLTHRRLYPGTEAKYDRAYASAPAELASAFTDAGLQNVTDFRRGTDVWRYMEADADAASIASGAGPLDRLRASEAHRRLLASLADVMAPSAGHEGGDFYREIFHSDGPALKGPFKRGMFVLVVHPDRIAEYDERHANPWPDMMQALADSGFRNYSGFRSGLLVAYYGEFYPDMRTATDTIGATDVNRRWGESFNGIITTITDEDGRLFTADEVFHVD